MHDEHTSDNTLIMIAIIVIILIALVSSPHNDAATIPLNDSHSIYIETHNTNIDICGICINSDH